MTVEAEFWCPECGAENPYKAGFYEPKGDIPKQRYQCRKCGYRYTLRHNILKTNPSIKEAIRLCVKEKAKKLDLQTKTKSLEKSHEAEQQKKLQETKGKILQFYVEMQKDNYSPDTIKNYVNALELLFQKGADLENPESVKETLIDEKSKYMKHTYINAYSLYLRYQDKHWRHPRTRIPEKIHYVPPERDVDDLVAGSPKKTACQVQTLKETGMRKGELATLQWKDIDLERPLITLNKPEKGGLPRMFKPSEKLLRMLKGLPRTNEYVWQTPNKNTLSTRFYRARKRVAHKLANPNITKIGLHSLRRFYATKLYYKTGKDLIIVQEQLGHKSIDMTRRYIKRSQFLFQEDKDNIRDYDVKALRTTKIQEMVQLLSIGFEKYMEVEEEGVILFRRPKKDDSHFKL